MSKLVSKPLCLFVLLLFFYITFIQSTDVLARNICKQETSVKETGDFQETSDSIGESISTNDQLTPEIDVLFNNLFSDIQVGDKAALMATITRGYAVSENALGDMNEDGYINIWDLLRVRNIYLGIGDPASSYESSEGDMNQDQIINEQDIYTFRDALIQITGIPHMIDSTGGVVEGAGVIATFGPGEVDSSIVIRIDNRTPSYFEDSTGADFSALAEDSVYFMKGFKFEANSDNYIFPPQMEIQLDSMPPCSLNGSNSLMTARKGPRGVTELIYLTNLEISEDSTLLVPPPPYPVISTSKTAYEPGELMEIMAENLSNNLMGNIVYFTSDYNEWFPVTPVEYIIDTLQDPEELIGIIVPVYPLLSGPAKIKLQHAGTGLLSNETEIDILPLHVFNGNLDSSLNILFSIIDSILYYDSIQIDMELSMSYPHIANNLLSNLSEIKMIFQDMLDSLINSNNQLKDRVLSLAENIGLPVAASRSYIYKSSCQVPNIEFSASRREHGTEQRLMVYGGIIVTCASGALLPCAFGVGYMTYNVWDWLFEESWKSTIKKYYGGLTSYRYVTTDNFEKSDPSYNPYRVPGHWCMNAWQHNTNAMGSTAGYPDDDCPGQCCESPPPPCPPAMGDGKSSGFDGLTRSNPVLPDWASYMISPLKNFIVIPLDGSNVYGTVGIVDGAGAFAIPGMIPGDSCNFAMYDPYSGHYDYDAGYGIAPDTAEMGLWFPVFLYFDPDTTAAEFTIDIGEIVTDEIKAGRPKIEYSLFVEPEQVGDDISINFFVEKNRFLTFWFRDPMDNFIIRDSITTGVFEYPFNLEYEGVYKLTVLYGHINGDGGKYILGLNNFPDPATPYLYEDIQYDSLSLEYSPHIVGKLDRNCNVLEDDSLIIEPNAILEFLEKGRLTADGSALGITSQDNPIILKPLEYDSLKSGRTNSPDVLSNNSEKEVIQ